MTRMLVKLYDHQRSGNYNFDNCKHLACTEIRAAQFHSQCNPKERSKLKVAKFTKTAQEKLISNEFCMREVATEHLKEKEKCALKAERYVDYVFDKCKNDSAPYNSTRTHKLKSFTDIM